MLNDLQPNLSSNNKNNEEIIFSSGYFFSLVTNEDRFFCRSTKNITM